MEVNKQKTSNWKTQAPSTWAKIIFSPPFSFDAFQEYLCKDGLFAKTHKAVETL